MGSITSSHWWVEDPSYDSEASGALADNWKAEYEVIDQTELVACLNRTVTGEGQLCEGYKDDDSGTE